MQYRLGRALGGSPLRPVLGISQLQVRLIVLRFSPGVIVVCPNNETLRAVNRPFLFIYKENIRAIHVCAVIAAQTHHHNVNRKSP